MSTAHSLRYLANCSMLFTELAVLERPGAARAAGFDAIEYWWPWATATPTDAQVALFVTAVKDAGVQLTGLNFFAGDLAGPDCGVLSLPSRAGEFRDSVDIAVSIGEQLGVSVFNALYGVRTDNATPAEQDACARESLTYATKATAGIDATVLIEAVSGPKPYPLRTAADAAAVVRQLRQDGAANIGILLDLFHLASNGDDVTAAIGRHVSSVAHVQIADAPGRGEPGTGALPLDVWLAQLQNAGYDGRVGLEYRPSTGNTLASLAWLPGGTQ
ncbi:MAG TPA: TIM barrel protein [Streptosporangiaceae bacterium]|jgi:hydroxypyruvate isomerase